MTKLTFVGDIFPGDEFFTCGYGIKSKTDKEHVKLWKQNITEIVGKTDYLVGNLEGPLVDDRDALKKTFHGRPLFADLLKDCGFNVLNIANNHIMEHGIRGFYQTTKILHDKGLAVIGGMKDNESEILTIKHGGTNICIAGFCDERVCNIDNPNCYASLKEGKVFETLERMKTLEPDIIVFIFHWGNEYIHIPSLEQRQLSYRLIDNGVDLIIGHHPHVIQPYEKYKHGHIIYSLGNFCFDDVQSAHFGKGMIAQITIQDRTICDVAFSGIQVQDMAYSEQLVRSTVDRVFNRYFLKINDKYGQLKELVDTNYQKIYVKALRREHFMERIRMRLSILTKAIDIRHRYKAQLLCNIKEYLL